MATQILRDDNGNPVFAMVPWPRFKEIAPEEAEAALSDEDLYDIAKAEGGEAFPAEVVDRLIDGESPLKVYREYRDLTQKKLAEAAGVSAMYVSQIERGMREGSTSTLKKLAAALKVDLADIAPAE